MKNDAAKAWAAKVASHTSTDMQLDDLITIGMRNNAACPSSLLKPSSVSQIGNTHHYEPCVIVPLAGGTLCISQHSSLVTFLFPRKMDLVTRKPLILCSLLPDLSETQIYQDFDRASDASVCIV